MAAASAAAARAAKTQVKRNGEARRMSGLSNEAQLRIDSPARRMSRALSEGVIKLVKDKKEGTGPNQLWRQREIREKYESNVIQISVAIVIGLNFVISAINAQVLPPEGSETQKIFLGFEIFFAVVFTIELVWNMYGSWWCYFWMSGWNWCV
jgi:hypothetical protein